MSRILPQRLTALPRQLRAIWLHPLNRGRKFRGIARWASWQLTSRLSGKPRVVPFWGPAKLWARAGETGITGNIYYGLAEYEDMAFAIHLLDPSDLFVDVGANAGTYSVLAGRVSGARVIAFEPIAETADRFDANMRLNQIAESTVLHRTGVGAALGVLRFTADRDTINHVIDSANDGIEVQVETLDNILANESPTLIKVDVEGYEPDVLAGANKTLLKKSLLALIIEINDSFRAYGHNISDILDPIEAAGFKPYAYDPVDRQLIALQRQNQASGNTIFVRDYERVLEKLGSSKNDEFDKTIAAARKIERQ